MGITVFSVAFIALTFLALLGQCFKTESYLQYLPRSSLYQTELSPLVLFRRQFADELALGDSRLQAIERAFIFLDNVMGRSSSEKQQHQNGESMNICTDDESSKTRFYSTVFFGTGFFSQFQSFTKSLLYGLHHTKYSIPVIPQGHLVGYSTANACAFADRSFHCYFQHLSSCQSKVQASNTSHSSILHPSHYRYKPFNTEMIPEEFQSYGPTFWWGTMQYYVFLHIHPTIFEDYILKDALYETSSFLEHYTSASSALKRSNSGNVRESSRSIDPRRTSPPPQFPPRSSQYLSQQNRLQGQKHHSSLPTLRNLQALDYSPERMPRTDVVSSVNGNVMPKRNSLFASSASYTMREASHLQLRKRSRAARGHLKASTSPSPMSSTHSQLLPSIKMPPHNNKAPPVPVSRTSTERSNWKSHRNAPASDSHVHPSPTVPTSTLDSVEHAKSIGSNTHRRSLLSLSILSLPRIGVHLRTRIDPVEEETKTNISTRHKPILPNHTLLDVNVQMRQSRTSCPLFVEVAHATHPYVQCFAPLYFYPPSTNLSSPSASSDAQSSSNNTSNNANSLVIWKLVQWLQAALDNHVTILSREFMQQYVATWNQDLTSSTPSSSFSRGSSPSNKVLRSQVNFATTDNKMGRLSVHNTSNYNQSNLETANESPPTMFVRERDIRKALSILKLTCNAPSSGCNLPAENVFLQRMSGRWVLPVDVFFATDDNRALQVAQLRPHWVSFPPGISLVVNREYTLKGSLFLPPRAAAPPTSASKPVGNVALAGRGRTTSQFHAKYKHIGAMLQSSSYLSYYTPYPVQASLEVLRDMYYLAHACSGLIGSSSSHLFRVSVGLAIATHRVSDVRWLETEQEKIYWKEKLHGVSMPIPELSDFL